MKIIICYSTIFIFVILLMMGCFAQKKKNLDKKEVEVLSITGNIHFNHTIDSLLLLFIQKANCENCCYEMYVDKRDPEDTVITLSATSGYFVGDNYLDIRKPVMYTKIGNHIFYIFTGIEDLIESSSFNKDIALKSSSSYYEYSWIIKISGGKLTAYEDVGCNVPFCKLDFGGVIKFKNPNSKNEE